MNQAFATAETQENTSDRLWLSVIEFIATLLLVADVCVLFAGVVARYGFGSPLVWSDELAELLFLWLGLLGSVLALSRGEHMRLSGFVDMCGPRVRRLLDTIAAIMIVVFAVEILRPAVTYIQVQWQITTPGLGISDSYRVASLLVAAVLMLVLALQLLFRRSRLKEIVIALLIVCIAGVALFAAKPLLISMGNWNLLIFFVLIVGALVVIGLPIAFAFGIATLSYLAFTTQVPLFIVVNQMDNGMSSLILLAIPLFVFLGLLIDATGMAAVLVNFLAALVGHFRGGLSYVLIGAMYLISGISGAKAADMAAIAPVLLPEMKRRDYDENESVSLLAASSAMSETVPPSLILITIGSVTGLSIAALFTAGLLPAAVGAVALAFLAYFRARRAGDKRQKAASARTIAKTFILAVPALLLPIVIRFAVVAGVATATEVSTVGVVYTLIVGPLVYRKFNWGRLYPILVETATLSGAILLIIGTATGMGWALTQSGFAADLVSAISGVPGGKVTFLALSIVLFALVGSLLEGIPAIVLFGPLLFPVANAVGVNEIHYAMIAILAMGLGLFAPPFGVGFYISCAIGRATPEKVARKIFPYLGMLLLSLILVAAVPWISLGFL